MDQAKPNPVIDELIAKATAAIQETAQRLSDALENLEDRDLLAALGALSGCGSAPVYGRLGPSIWAATAVPVPGALTSRRCISTRDDKEAYSNDVRWF